MKTIRKGEPMKKRIIGLFAAALVFGAMGIAAAASQDRYGLPEPYLAWEKGCLKEFPELQGLMDIMIGTTVAQLKEPEADILHNRVCSALAYEMAKKLSREERKLAVATDILHNISKEDKAAVLTNPETLAKASGMVSKLKKEGYFKGSPGFWGDEAVLKNPKVGGNLGLIHHITGALTAGEIAAREKYSSKDIDMIQAAVLEHSTGYWYFRDSVDAAAGRKGAWQVVYPEPENEIAKIAHDADRGSRRQQVAGARAEALEGEGREGGGPHRLLRVLPPVRRGQDGEREGAGEGAMGEDPARTGEADGPQRRRGPRQGAGSAENLPAIAL
jgi:hypothetical protein